MYVIKEYIKKYIITLKKQIFFFFSECCLMQNKFSAYKQKYKKHSNIINTK